MSTKKVWTATLEITQECKDKDVNTEQVMTWLMDHFNATDFGAVRCVNIEMQSLTTVTFAVNQCPSMYGLRLTLEAILGQTDTSTNRWVYTVALNPDLWALLTRIAANYSCLIHR